MFKLPGYQISTKVYESKRSLIYRGSAYEGHLPVILKFLHRENPQPEDIARFRREYEIIRRLRDIPGVIQAYELINFEKHLVMVLEDFSGQSLESYLTSNTLDLATFLSLASHLAEILSYIHEQGVIHKDINPANIILNADLSQVKIIDFGIASVLQREETAVQHRHVLDGTIAYISPEQSGRVNWAIDYRSDLYSLGATFYKMLTNQTPFQTKDALEMIHYHIAKIPQPPHVVKPGIPPVVSAIILKLLAKTPPDRYRSVSGLLVDLQRCQEQLQQTAKIARYGEVIKGRVSKGYVLPAWVVMEVLVEAIKGSCRCVGVKGIVVHLKARGIDVTVQQVERVFEQCGLKKILVLN